MRGLCRQGSPVTAPMAQHDPAAAPPQALLFDHGHKDILAA